MINLSPEVTCVLKEFGWTTDRQVSITPIIEGFKPRKYKVFPEYCEIMTSLYGIHVASNFDECRPVRGIRAGFEDIVFDPLQCSTDLSHRRLMMWTTMLPVACLDYIHCLFVTSKSEFWVESIGFFSVGKSLDKALRMILLGEDWRIM